VRGVRTLSPGKSRTWKNRMGFGTGRRQGGPSSRVAHVRRELWRRSQAHGAVSINTAVIDLPWARPSSDHLELPRPGISNLGVTTGRVSRLCLISKDVQGSKGLKPRLIQVVKSLRRRRLAGAVAARPRAARTATPALFPALRPVNKIGKGSTRGSWLGAPHVGAARARAGAGVRAAPAF
jgi:hypothetical protein